MNPLVYERIPENVRKLAVLWVLRCEVDVVRLVDIVPQPQEANMSAIDHAVALLWLASHFLNENTAAREAAGYPSRIQ